MSNALYKRATLPVIDAAICTLRARNENGGMRSEIAFSGLSLLHQANRAYSLGLFPSEEARMLSQLVLSLAAALPANADDRREARA